MQYQPTLLSYEDQKIKHHFNGIAYDPAHLFGQATNVAGLECFDRQASHLPQGEYLYVKQTAPGQFLVKSDFFGFGPVFYTTPTLNSIGVSAISNSLEALANFLKSKGENVTIDAATAYPVLASRYSFFNQAYSNQTLCTQIKMLGADETLTLNSKGGSIAKTDFFVQGGNYQDTLDKAVTNIAASLKKSFDHFGRKPIKLFLSGGKDSRACLALLLFAGIPPDAIHCVTSNPDRASTPAGRKNFADDLQVAAHLVDTFGLRWHKTEPYETIPIGFEDSLAEWRSWRLGVYYNAHTVRFRNRPQPVTNMEIRGGGGEALRGFWGDAVSRLNVFERIGNTPKSSADDFRLFFKSIVPSDGSSAVQESAEIFARNANALPGSVFLEKIDNHYNLFRNRSHFGHIRHSADSGVALHFPLAYPLLFHGSQFLSYRERVTGVMIFDIIEATCPALNRIDFDSAKWSDELMALRHHVDQAAIGNADLSEYHENAAASAKVTASIYSKYTDHNFDITKKTDERVKRNLGKVKELPGLVGAAEIMRKNVEKNKSHMRYALGKTESITCILDKTV